MRDLGFSLALLSSASMCSAAGNGGDLSLRISDDFTSPGNPAPSVDRVSNDAFRTFISATLEGLGREAVVEAAGAQPDLRFERVALAASGDEVPKVARREPTLPAGGCALSSPWVDVALTADGSVAEGTIYWNERQILRDHAALDGIAPPKEPAVALPRGEYNAMARKYSQARMQGGNLAAGEIPSDLLWLFTHAPQSTRGPFEFGAGGKMREIADQSAEFYGSLVAALLERCRQAKGQTTTIKTISEVRDAIDLERLRTH